MTDAVVEGLRQIGRRLVVAQRQPGTGGDLDEIDLTGFLERWLPSLVRSNRSYITIAVGCTGGNHRSVVLAQEVARLMEERGFAPTVSHRDVNRR